jgi:hypothetical protein
MRRQIEHNVRRDLRLEVKTARRDRASRNVRHEAYRSRTLYDAA